MRKGLVSDVVEVIALVDGFFAIVFLELLLLILLIISHRMLNLEFFYQ